MLGTWWALKTLVTVAVISYALAQLQEMNIDEDGNIKRAVDLFNAQSNVSSVFKQISYLSPGYQQIEEDFEIVNFLVKQTMCIKSEEYNIAECDFNPDGEIKMCTAYVSEELDAPNIACSTISENRRSKRATKKRCNIVCKLKAGARSTIATIKIPTKVFRRT
uniref:Vipericidin n=1 Tax=Leptobrachium leishanense TaxID=445787 RepID=A0A8C5MGU4_9ANUR